MTASGCGWGAWARHLLAGGVLLWSAVAGPQAMGGTYIFASEELGVDIVTHPAGYQGEGAALTVEVCIDATAADAQAMVVPVQNVVKEFNLLQGASPNLVFGLQNDIPNGAIDFESLLLHEIGHCIGLGHPNLGLQTGVSGTDTEFTASGAGQDGQFAFGPGSDGIVGSADDQRGDDQNLHWFEIGVNDAFAPVADPSAANYGRDLADLPAGDDYAINAARSVGALLGYPDTEAVMQQGQGTDEEQRMLQADDVATLRMAMTGLDRAGGTADDYVFRLVYGGIRTDPAACDIVIDDRDSGFGVCFVQGQFLGANDLAITAATVLYNPEYNWYFNPAPNPDCSAAEGQLSFSNTTETGAVYHEACDSIVYGPGYTVASTGAVTAIARSVSLQSGVSINGVFRVVAAVP